VVSLGRLSNSSLKNKVLLMIVGSFSIENLETLAMEVLIIMVEVEDEEEDNNE